MARLQSWRRQLAAVLLALLAVSNAARAEPIVVNARSVPLDASQPERTRVGSLLYRGGVELSSKDSRFGGLSGLRVSADGKRFVAIADIGQWMTGTLRYDAAGTLIGVGDVDLVPLSDTAGRPLRGKEGADAEAVTAADGGYIVAFEGNHRLVRYRRIGGPGEKFAAPPDLSHAPSNGGIETLTTLADGRLMAITETYEVYGGVRGWVGPAPWRPFVWPVGEGFRPTDATTLPDGDVLVLERRILPPAARIRRISAAELRPGNVPQPADIARLEGALTFDNMEGLAARRGDDGQTLIYILSDDNQSFLQQTLLMMFTLVPER